MPVLGRLKQSDDKFKVSLGDVTRPLRKITTMASKTAERVETPASTLNDLAIPRCTDRSCSPSCPMTYVLLLWHTHAPPTHASF